MICLQTPQSLGFLKAFFLKLCRLVVNSSGCKEREKSPELAHCSPKKPLFAAEFRTCPRERSPPGRDRNSADQSPPAVEGAQAPRALTQPARLLQPGLAGSNSRYRPSWPAPQFCPVISAKPRLLIASNPVTARSQSRTPYTPATVPLCLCPRALSCLCAQPLMPARP